MTNILKDIKIIVPKSYTRPEVEVGFGTFEHGKFIQNINVIAFKRIYKTLQSTVGTEFLPVNVVNSIDIMSNDVRITLNGRENIVQFCKTNKPDVKQFTFMKKIKDRQTTTNIEDYGIRIRISDEIPIQETAIGTSPMVFRYKQRTSFVSLDKFVSIDLTCVKQATGTSIINSNVLNSPEKYEVEVELLTAGLNHRTDIGDELPNIQNILEKYVVKLLQIMNETPYILSKTEQNNILKEYLIAFYSKQVQQTPQKTLQQTLQSALLNPKQYFIGLDVVAMNWGNILLNSPKIDENHLFNTGQNVIHYMTDKADGIRHLLFGSKKIYALDMKLNVKFTGFETSSDKLWLLDCEIVQIDDNTEKILVFDTFLQNGVDCRREPLEKRVEYSKNFIGIISNRNTNNTEMPIVKTTSIQMKQYYPVRLTGQFEVLLDAVNNARDFPINRWNSKYVYVYIDQDVSTDSIKIVLFREAVYILAEAGNIKFIKTSFTISKKDKSIQKVLPLLDKLFGFIFMANCPETQQTTQTGNTKLLELFDIISSNNANVPTLFTQRYGILRDKLSTMFSIKIKDYNLTIYIGKSSNPYNLLHYVNKIGLDYETPYNKDGVIYTPNTHYPIQETGEFHLTSSLKWKPPDKQTIDFLVRPNQTVLIVEDRRYLNVDLLVRQRGDFVVFKNVPIFIGTNSNDLIVDGVVVKTGSNYVIEFRFDNTLKKYGDTFGWIPIKIRYDKMGEIPNPNAYLTAKETVELIHNPIPLEQDYENFLKVATQKETGYYGVVEERTASKSMTTFHNLVKKELIRTAIGSLTLNTVKILDLGIGRGGDLNKYLNTTKSVILVGVDNGIDTVQEAQRRSDERKDKKNIVELYGNINCSTPFITYSDLSKSLQKYNKFNIVSSQFAIHYMLTSPDNIYNLFSNIVQYMDREGVLIGTTFDGQSVINLLKNKPEWSYSYKNKLVLSIKMATQTTQPTQSIKPAQQEQSTQTLYLKPYGQNIRVFVESIAHEMDEPLVNMDYLDYVASQFGLIPAMVGTLKHRTAFSHIQGFTQLDQNLRKFSELNIVFIYKFKDIQEQMPIPPRDEFIQLQNSLGLSDTEIEKIKRFGIADENIIQSKLIYNYQISKYLDNQEFVGFLQQKFSENIKNEETLETIEANIEVPAKLPSAPAHIPEIQQAVPVPVPEVKQEEPKQEEPKQEDLRLPAQCC